MTLMDLMSLLCILLPLTAAAAEGVNGSPRIVTVGVCVGVGVLVGVFWMLVIRYLARRVALSTSETTPESLFWIFYVFVFVWTGVSFPVAQFLARAVLPMLGAVPLR